MSFGGRKHGTDTKHTNTHFVEAVLPRVASDPLAVLVAAFLGSTQRGLVLGVFTDGIFYLFCFNFSGDQG